MMKCEFCSAELDEGVTRCPSCGKDLPETKKPAAVEAPKKERRELKIALAVTGLVLLTEVLAGAVLHYTGVINIEGLLPSAGTQQTAPNTTDSTTGKESTNPTQPGGTGTPDSEKTEKPSTPNGETPSTPNGETPSTPNGETPTETERPENSYTKDLATVEQQGDVVIAQVGNQKLTNSELQIHYWNAVQDFLRYYGSDYVAYLGLDLEKSLDVQVYDKETGKTFQQFFLENAIESWKRYATLAQMSEDVGHQLTAAQQAELDNMPATIQKQAVAAGYTDGEAYVEKYFPGSSLQGFVNYNTVVLKAMYYYDVLYEDMMPTQAEVEAYYTENEAEFKENKKGKENGLYYDVRHIFIPVEGELGDINGVPSHTEEAWAQCLAKAQKVLNDFVAEKGDEAMFAQWAKELSGDPGSAQDGGSYTKLTKETGFVETFKLWYMDENRKPGDIGIVKNNQSATHGYHIMYFCKSYEIWEYEARNTLLAEKTDKTLDEAYAKWPITTDNSKIVLGEPEAPKTTEPTK